MADNYLERRYEEVFGGGARKAQKPHGPSLNTLLVRNRAFRRYKPDTDIPETHLREIVEVNTKIPSSGNLQPLRYLLVKKGLSAKHGPIGEWCRSKGYLTVCPPVFILIFSILEESSLVGINVGISLQSMALKACELGYGCTMTSNLDGPVFRDGFQDLGLGAPIAMLAVGKPDESVFLMPLTDATHEEKTATDYASRQRLMPYIKDGVNYIPKLTLDDIIL